MTAVFGELPNQNGFDQISMGNQHGESAWVRPNQHGRLSRDGRGGRDGRDGRVVRTLFLADVKDVEHVIVSNACPAGGSAW